MNHADGPVGGTKVLRLMHFVSAMGGGGRVVRLGFPFGKGKLINIPILEVGLSNPLSLFGIGTPVGVATFLLTNQIVNKIPPDYWIILSNFCPISTGEQGRMSAYANALFLPNYAYQFKSTNWLKLTPWWSLSNGGASQIKISHGHPAFPP